MHDTGTETATCPRHSREPAAPVLCVDCTDNARTAIWRLPEQHRQLLGSYYATRPKTGHRPMRQASSANGASPWPEYDHADDIERTLRTWANGWADLTGRDQNPTGGPAWSTRTLLDQRHGNPLHHPAAPDLAGDVFRLHRQAAVLLRDEEPRVRPARTHIPGVCDECDYAYLYRTAGSTLIRCGHCPHTMTEDGYREYARRVAAMLQGAA